MLEINSVLFQSIWCRVAALRASCK